MPKVTMAITDRDAERVAKIRTATQARSNAHSVSIAVSMTSFLVDALGRGDQILLRKTNGELERVVMAELEGVSPDQGRG